MQTRLLFSSLILALSGLSLGAAGCSSETSIGANSDNIVGVVSTDDGAAPPAMADLRIHWGVSSGSPDYSWVAGTGTLTSAGFEVTLPKPIPQDALNTYGGLRIGVGLIVAHEVGTAPAEGLDPTDEETPTVIGAAPRYAVLYREGTADDLREGVEIDENHWILSLPQGFSCGRGVAAPEGETFDSFEVVDCDTVELVIGDPSQFDFVNWT